MSLMMSGDKGISAFPDGDTLLTWVATVTGPDDSVYEGEYKRWKTISIGKFNSDTLQWWKPS